MAGVRGGRARPRSPFGALLLSVFAAALAAAPASATPLPPPSNPGDPLPGSSFQGADGNQDDAAPLVDWQALQEGFGVRHSPDPNAQDDQFTQGSKELEPGEWVLDSKAGGVTPAKDNILDAWSAGRQPGGNTFLYLGFTREKALGTTFLTFELNHDERLWRNEQGAEIPCRRTGDVLVSYEAHGNDPVAVVIRRWITESTDPDTGCAKTGRLSGYTGFTPNVDAQGAMNEAEEPIRNWLGGASGETIPRRLFGETALNLATLLEEGFGDDCLSFRSIWMHSRSSLEATSAMQDYVAPQPLDVRTCSAAGAKFFDRDADGVRDPEEPGIPRFLIFADYDDDGQLDPTEPRTVSDNQGQYVLHDIRPPDGTYRLRETLLAGRRRTAPLATDWICSFPNNTTSGGTGSATGVRFPCAWGPLNVDVFPDARDRDFGNWFPAQLTLEKEIEPPADAGQFDLLVNGVVRLPAAGDGASTTISVPPGVYDVSEAAVPPINAADYRSTVECRRNSEGRGRRRAGTRFASVALAAGDRATCTFRNIRPGSPAIAIRKVGQDLAEAGDTLNYTFYVTNPGDVPFPAAGVNVSDPVCDAPPALREKQDGSGADDSPGTLDPGDTWVYDCSNDTTAPGDACEPSTVDNTGTVTGTANGSTVQDTDSISTILLCPDRPPPPDPEPPDPPGPDPPGPDPPGPDPPGPDGPRPDEPGAVVPPGPRPPNAGDAAVAGFRFRQATRRCIFDRVPRVNFRGTNIRRVRVYVKGQLRRNLTLRTLQRRITPRVTFPPGRYRVTARLTFQRGSGSPPVTLTRVIRICAAAQPRFTG